MMWLCGGVGMVRCGDAMVGMSSRQQLLTLRKASRDEVINAGATPAKRHWWGSR